MKKYKIVISAIFVTLLSINTFMTTETFKDNTLSLNEVMSFAIAHAAEIGEITVHCSSGTYGPCRRLSGDFCPGYPLVMDVYAHCIMTDDPSDSCSQEDEVECD